MKQKIFSYLSLIALCIVKVPAVVLLSVALLLPSLYLMAAAALLGDRQHFDEITRDIIDRLQL